MDENGHDYSIALCLETAQLTHIAGTLWAKAKINMLKTRIRCSSCFNYI